VVNFMYPLYKRVITDSGLQDQTRTSEQHALYSFWIDITGCPRPKSGAPCSVHCMRIYRTWCGHVLVLLCRPKSETNVYTESARNLATVWLRHYIWKSLEIRENRKFPRTSEQTDAHRVSSTRRSRQIEDSPRKRKQL